MGWELESRSWELEYNRGVTVLEAIGGEAGCRNLSRRFYARVAREPVLKRLFPGKSLRCATEEFAAFLIQFLGGHEAQTQKRWWLSLSESHARFEISREEQAAWLRHMSATLDESGLGGSTHEELRAFFGVGASYVSGREAGASAHGELADRWTEQRALDEAVAEIAAGRDAASIRFATRPSVFVGLLMRMMKAGRSEFVLAAVQRDPGLVGAWFAGRTLLHAAAATGHVDVVRALLAAGTPVDVWDEGGHTPLYAVANECGSDAGPDVVRVLVEAGADVNASSGVTRATPLHMAARRGHVAIAKALLECGAEVDARDRNGCTPLERARNCRKAEVARLLAALSGRASD